MENMKKKNKKRKAMSFFESIIYEDRNENDVLLDMNNQRKIYAEIGLSNAAYKFSAFFYIIYFENFFKYFPFSYSYSETKREKVIEWNKDVNDEDFKYFLYRETIKSIIQNNGIFDGEIEKKADEISKSERLYRSYMYDVPIIHFTYDQMKTYMMTQTNDVLFWEETSERILDHFKDIFDVCEQKKLSYVEKVRYLGAQTSAIYDAIIGDI